MARGSQFQKVTFDFGLGRWKAGAEMLWGREQPEERHGVAKWQSRGSGSHLVWWQGLSSTVAASHRGPLST